MNYGTEGEPRLGLENNASTIGNSPKEVQRRALKAFTANSETRPPESTNDGVPLGGPDSLLPTSQAVRCPPHNNC